MRNLIANMNPLLRGLLVLALIALVVVVLNLNNAVSSLLLIARIAFPIAIAFFLYLMWRERRDDIATWPSRLRIVFYGAALTLVVDFLLLTYLGLFFERPSGYDALAFVLTLMLCGYAMFRTWRDAHTYGD